MYPTPIGPAAYTVFGNLIALAIILSIALPTKMRWYYVIPLFLAIQLLVQAFLASTI